MDNNPQNLRIKNLDYLRAAAILMVMTVHFPRFRQIFPVLNPWSGVDLFFAISGFVVAKSYVSQVDRAVALKISASEKVAIFAIHAKAFFVRRFMRIMPAMVFALIFYISIGLWTEEPSLGSFSSLAPELFAIFTYTANLFGGYSGGTALAWHWSLAAEEQFYFIFPFFIAAFVRWRSRIAITLLGLSLMTFILRPYGATWFGAAPALMYLPQFRNDAIGYGFLIFALSQHPSFKLLRPKVIVNSYIVLIPTLVVLIGVVALAPQLQSYNIAIPTIGIASALLLYLALTAERSFFPIRSIARIFEWIGLRSYGIYLLHIPMVRLTQHLERRWIASENAIGYPIHFAIVLLSLYCVVELSYRLVEVPAMTLGRRWSREILSLAEL